ncbi:hypothetical protein LTR94_026616, partial [Friedmanniomyces endolithicus]
HAVDWVQRGDSADTALKTHHYDCVLLDRGLPALSGDDLLARLALVPRTLEARGLDASPLIRNKLAGAGDAQSAAIVDIILRDEIEAVGGRIAGVVMNRARWKPPALLKRFIG